MVHNTDCSCSDLTCSDVPSLRWQVSTSPGRLLAERTPSPRLGVTLEEHGSSFRVWAPHARNAQLELEDGTSLPLVRDGDTWAGAFPPGEHPWTVPWQRRACSGMCHVLCHDEAVAA